jgi:hypothetical protein
MLERKKSSARLLSATAVVPMAVVSGVTVMPNARIAGVALTGLHCDKALAAMGKTLEPESGKRVLRGQERGRAHKSDEPLFHNNPRATVRPHLTTMIFGVEEFFKEFAQPISRPETRDGSNYAKQAVI